jgi:hypothetical protein
MRKILLISLLIFLSGCFSAKWDETELKVDALGVNKELEGLKISQDADGSFSIEIEKSTVEGQDSFQALLSAVYEAGMKAGTTGKLV